MFGIPRIFSRAVERGLIGRAHSELVHIGTAKRYHAFIEQVLHDGGSVGGDKVVQHFGAARAAPACLAENVFVGDGYAGKRGGVALSDTSIGSAGFGKGLVLVERDVAVDSRVLRSNGGEVASSTAEICLDWRSWLACLRVYWVMRVFRLKIIGILKG